MTEKVSLETAIEVVLRNGPTFETIAGLCKMAVEASQFLAPPMQEPVVWMYQDKNTHEVLFQKHMKSFVDHSRLYETPLYTHPSQRTWVGLTDGEVQAVTDPENQPSQYGTVTLDYHFEKLKEWEDRFEKLSDRALAQPVQEPVGSVVRWLDGSLVHGWFNDPPPEGTLLYITPPQPEERNFCPRCGKRTADLTTIHTCTPPRGNT